MMVGPQTLPVPPQSSCISTKPVTRFSCCHVGTEICNRPAGYSVLHIFSLEQLAHERHEYDFQLIGVLHSFVVLRPRIAQAGSATYTRRAFYPELPTEWMKHNISPGGSPAARTTSSSVLWAKSAVSSPNLRQNGVNGTLMVH